MDQPTLRRMTSCLGFARRQAKKNHMVEVIYPIDVALSFLVGEKWRMCDLPGPRPGIGRKVLPLDELIPHRCNVPDRGTSNVAIQTGDELIAAPLADIIAKNVQVQVAEATAHCKNAMVQQEQRMEELQAHIAQLQSAITCSASCFVLETPTPFADPVPEPAEGVERCSRAQAKQARREDRRRQLEQLVEESRRASGHRPLDFHASNSVIQPMTHRTRPPDDRSPANPS